MVEARSAGVASTNAPMCSDRELGRTVLQYPSLFPFPFLQRSHHEQRPAQGEGRPLAVWLSAQRCRFGSDSRWSLTRKQMTGFEAVGVFENASRPPLERRTTRSTIPAQTGLWEA